MKLIFAYIRSFKNIHDQEFSLSDDYSVSFAENQLRIRKTDNDEVKRILFGGNLIKDLHIIVGRTGAGKTNLLQLIGMQDQERGKDSQGDAYFLLYKCSGVEDLFAVEVFNMFIPQIFRILRMRTRKGQVWTGLDFYRFRYDFGSGSLKGVESLEESMWEDTAIVNTFDRNAFARYPYHDAVDRPQNRWLPRKVIPYAESFPGAIVRAAREYVVQMPVGSVKRRASFILNRENWQNKLNVELDRSLVEKEYWQYGERRQGGRVKSLSDVPWASVTNGKLPKGRIGTQVSPKEMFIHDLLTDYAIYLRKIASSVQALSGQLSGSRPLVRVDVDDPTVLPDGHEDLSLEQRLSWLGQYIDYHTDGYFGNKGLVWQETTDITDVAHILQQFDDRYFTSDQFIYPVFEIAQDDKRFQDLFERMGQYHRDQYEVFPREFLPYELSYLSSGEFQYAKIWGSLEEAIETKMIRYREGTEDGMKEQQLIVLMDEPETYLHPEFCREFIARTADVLGRRHPDLQLQLILTTHSPFMLSDTISSQVTRIDYDEEGECVVYEDAEKPFFAANIFSIMADGFFLDYTIGEYSRRFLSDKYQFLMCLLEKHPYVTSSEWEEIQKIHRILPYIGDEMIRHSFSVLLRFLGYATIQN